jgi:putative membrane-bound dehydrogenase-like protein
MNALSRITLLCAVSAVMLPAHAAELKFPTQTFTVPDGFEVELVVNTNLVERPVSAGFDDQGRLYVTDSSGSSEKPDKQLADPTHRVIRLEDTDGDGKFDKSVVFADKVMFPQGCLWHDGSVYVAAPPSIWKFTDTDGDGVADKREEWFKGVTLTGCANDIHGPYLGPDGYLYWTKGAFAEQTHKLGNGRTLNDKAAHIYRARPDGSDLDVIMSGGMDNPVEVAFTAEGEAIFTSTFIDFSQPGYRDGIAHAVYGGVFGKQNDVLEDGRVKRTGPDLMHPFYQAGNAAECGLCRYESAVFGADYRDNFFATTFNLHKITRHVLRPQGATYASADSDFLVSDSTDFHPTDVLEDADGSLLVVDTGGWYKLCCPSSQLAKPDVLGAIYRVRRKSIPKIEDARGLKIRWTQLNPAELTQFLDDHRPYVVNRAIRQLAAGKSQAIPALSNTLKNSKSLDARRNAVWALTQIDGPAARRAVYNAFPTGANFHLPPDDSAAQAAIYSIGLWRDTNAFSAPLADDFGAVVALSDALGSPNASLRRAAVETWGRTASDKKHAVHHLLGSADHDSYGLLRKNDRFLEHSLTYALIELNDPKTTAEALTNRFMQRIALIALDQMDGSDLKAPDVLPFLSAADSRLREAATWIYRRHPEWAAEGATFARELLSKPRTAEEQKRLVGMLAIAPVVQTEIAKHLAAASPAEQALLLEAVAEARPKEFAPEWVASVRTALGCKDQGVADAAVNAARALSPDAKKPHPAAAELKPLLLDLARDTTRPIDLRLDALLAIAGPLEGIDAALFDLAVGTLDPAQAPPTRARGLQVLQRAKFDKSDFLKLADALPRVGPLELPRLLTVFEQQPDEELGHRLLAALRQSTAAKSLPAASVRTLCAKFPAAVRTDAATIIQSLDADAAKQAERLDALLAELKSQHSDIRRGQAIFNSSKTACSACHKIGYLGGNIGPDLTRISEARTERDLLESVVFPSASFVRSYEPVIVVTKSGEDYSGVLRKDAPDELVIATGPNAETRIARSDVAQMRPGTVSVMPAGLDEQLSKQELADLIAFLKGTKW